jgi:hypothetical protein
MTAPATILYGDFSCPWSYLSYRRLALLRTAGEEFELRAVQHDPARPGRPDLRSKAFEHLHQEMGRVVAQLLPGEELPYELRGFVPHTKAAVSGYAEAYGAGVPDVAAPLLFEAFWRNGLDVDDPRCVRTLLVDAIRGGGSPSDPLRRWGHAVDVTGGPMTTLAWRVVRAWRHQWQSLDKEVVPVLLLPDGTLRYGVDAVECLGRRVAASGIDPATQLSWPDPRPPAPVDGHGRAQLLYPPLGAA